MRTFFIVIICLMTGAFALYEIMGLIRDFKKRKNKSKEKGVTKK